MGDPLIERDRDRGCILLLVRARGEASSNCTAPRLIQIQKYGGVAYGVRRNPSAMQIGFRSCLCFPALRFDAFSPYRDSRYCGAPKPGKEK